MRLATDENFNGDMLRGLLRRYPDLDVVRVQDTEMFKAPDPDMLEWVAQQNRILLTHDARTVPGHAFERVSAGQYMPGVIVVNDLMPIGQAIEELLTIVLASEASEWENRVMFVPIQSPG